MSKFRTPLKNARGLGSAKSGTVHFIHQRLTAAALAPILALFVFDRPYPIAVMALVMAVLIFIRHKDNIGRLLRGEEPRSGVGKKKDAA